MQDMITRARSFAVERHQGQTRKGAAKEPYTVHLEEVAALVAEFGGSHEVIAAAWLHDTVEDCEPTSHEEIAAIFGDAIASIVAEVTDDKNLPKEERKRLQIVNAPKKSAQAALLKICDKISNIRAIGNSPPEDWPGERQLAYLAWAVSVVENLPALPDAVQAEFRASLSATEAAILERIGHPMG
ncbi:HD domain-containing protein [Ostreiculturibacter nitratireducens]|uniref:HD domain-containing protein n=1 Tax=Ostreiculturibacter nitratireducens TaxID=3075226 RepID=UPI0031B5CD2C